MKKGQAAMEFLMTYGWAILVVLAAIAALAYFGVLSPAKYLPERCTGPAGMDCLEKATILNESEAGDEMNVILFAFKNNQGKTIVVTDITSGAQANVCSGFGGNAISVDGGAYETPSLLAGGVSMDNGQMAIVNVSCSTGDFSDRVSEEILVVYESADTGLEHRASYEITGKRSNP